MKGLRIDSPDFPRQFTHAFRSVLDAFAPYYWFLDGYGPFNLTGKSNSHDLEAQLELYSVPIEGVDYGPPGLWRPGFLPWAADLLVIDEGTTLVGIRGNEDEAIATARQILAVYRFSPQFFDLIQRRTEVALLYIDGWWEAYSTNLQLMLRIAQINGTSDTESEALLRHLNFK